MAVPAHALLDATSRLYSYLLREHWNGRALVGPDSGVRFNARVGRFIKSYLSFLPWSDSYAYMQAQGYWILDNWLMTDVMDREQCRDLALACSGYVLAAQNREGYWEYPNPEWKARVATVEGCFATLGLLESYCRVQHESLLVGAKKWHRFLVEQIGFQGSDGLVAINYFANVPGAMVPNNATLALLTLAKLAAATNDDQYIAPCHSMVAWLRKVQLETGELPYALEGSGRRGHRHFLCYQYNAFEFLDLVQYHSITEDQTVWPILEGMAVFLSQGISDSGAARYDCYREKPEVSYYTTAVAAALSQATVLGLGDFRALVDRAYRRVLSLQRTDGGFEFFSRGSYGLLADRRSYPRNLSMILCHLLSEVHLQIPSQAKSSFREEQDSCEGGR